MLSEVQQKLLTFLEEGKRLPMDPNETKAHAIQDLVDHAWRAYHFDWIILRNKSEQPFITSDNPLAFGWSGRPGDPRLSYCPAKSLIYFVYLVYSPGIAMWTRPHP